MRVANILMNTEPSEAVKKLNEMVGVLETEGLLDRRILEPRFKRALIGSPSCTAIRTPFATPSRRWKCAEAS
jgi:hypothetical protein